MTPQQVLDHLTTSKDNDEFRKGEAFVNRGGTVSADSEIDFALDYVFGAEEGELVYSCTSFDEGLGRAYAHWQHVLSVITEREALDILERLVARNNRFLNKGAWACIESS